MKTIVDGKEYVVRLLGKQRIKDTEYRRMKYVLQTDCEDGILLHNALTGHLVLLDDREAALLEKQPVRNTEALTELIEDYFLVPPDYDEGDTVRKARSILRRFLEPKGIKSYTILTTTNCNARCFYCYENGLPYVNMDAETADDLVEYMINHKGKGPLELHWFGGEPLVCPERIDQICEALSARDVRFASSMTSNGYLFTESLAEKAAASWKLNAVQITLDGTEEVYNRTKAYVSVSGSPYRRVLENIRLLLNHRIRVIIRLNLDRHNMEDLQNLIDELDRTIPDKKGLEIYSHILFEDAGSAPIRREEEDRAVLYARQNEINTELTRRGLLRSFKRFPFLKTHNCMADTGNAAVVYPDGRLFKCEHIQIGDEYGHIRTGLTQEAGIEKFRITTERDECESCPIYPSCILLKHCQGLPDKNRYTCGYEVEMAERSLREHYQERKGKAAKAENLSGQQKQA